MEHGIEIWVDSAWLYIPAKDREQADGLHQATWEGVPDAICRRVAKTEDGQLVVLHATA